MVTPPTEPEKTEPEKKAQLKELYRESRLSFRNFEEHQLRNELKSTAMDKCRDHLQGFGTCAEENGLLVVFKCQGKLKEMNECLNIYNSNAEFEKYKAKHRPDLMKPVKKAGNA
jgi:hypothetical protein